MTVRTTPKQRGLPVTARLAGGRWYAVTDPTARFWAKVQKGDGCWEWTGTISGGYGKFAITHQRAVFAHRFAYEQIVGAVPDGLQLDHLCRNRACVNPDHLEPVTCRENGLRGQGLNGINARKTHCLRGHPLEGTNLYEWRDHRHCRTCKNDAKRRRRSERQPAQLALALR
jgi:hypothetical protein